MTIPATTERPCRKCGELKPLFEFYRNSRRKEGYEYVCKICSELSRQNLLMGKRKVFVSQLDRSIKSNFIYYMSHNPHYFQETFGVEATQSNIVTQFLQIMNE